MADNKLIDRVLQTALILGALTTQASAGWCFLEARFEPPGGRSFYAITVPLKVDDSMHCHRQITRFPQSMKDHWGSGLYGDSVANPFYQDKLADARTWFRIQFNEKKALGYDVYQIDDYQVDYGGM